MSAASQHLLLIGGGHAHVAVLADWIENGLACKRATLLTPQRHLRYSGMVPGRIAGQYDRGNGTVDLAGLAQRAGVQVVLGRCTAIEPDERRVRVAGGQAIEFDVASIDTGGVGRAEQVLGKDPRLIDIRPIDRFVETLDTMNPQARIAVVGGGAGGTELAFALRNWKGAQAAPKVTFITGSDGLLPEMSSAVRKAVMRELDRQGIVVHVEDAFLNEGQLRATNRCSEAIDLPVDLIVAALGSAAPDWPRKGGLACDEHGFIAVDRYQRSASHPHVFAVGDVAARLDRNVPHSGVHAVFAGPVLARNLRSAMSGGEPSHTYVPRWNNLYLMSTGNGSAIASYGPFTAKGRWVSRLKHWIDNRWISKYAKLAEGA